MYKDTAWFSGAQILPGIPPREVASYSYSCHYCLNTFYRIIIIT